MYYEGRLISILLSFSPPSYLFQVLYLSMVDPSSNRADGFTSAFPLPGGGAGGLGLGLGGYEGGDVSWTPPQEATMAGERKDNDFFGNNVGSGGEGYHRASIIDCRARAVAVLEPLAGDLADLLGADAFSGPAIWRVSALAALTAVLTALSPTRASAASNAPTHGLGRCVWVDRSSYIYYPLMTHPDKGKG